MQGTEPVGACEWTQAAGYGEDKAALVRVTLPLRFQCSAHREKRGEHQSFLLRRGGKKHFLGQPLENAYLP